jgi:hypothetical protein
VRRNYMLDRIDHVGVIVDDLEAASASSATS